MDYEHIIEKLGIAMDVFGVAVIIIGVVGVTGAYLAHLRTDPAAAYHRYRRSLGRSILLGLEVLVAADIIRTVAVKPTFTTVGVLAVIVAVRTFLSWSLEVELEGRWPWQAAAQAAKSKEAASDANTTAAHSNPKP